MTIDSVNKIFRHQSLGRKTHRNVPYLQCFTEFTQAEQITATPSVIGMVIDHRNPSSMQKTNFTSGMGTTKIFRLTASFSNLTFQTVFGNLILIECFGCRNSLATGRPNVKLNVIVQQTRLLVGSNIQQSK